MTQYVIYRRLSKEDKSKNQHGFDSQSEDCRHFLDSQHNSEVLGDFHEFISGGEDVKPELEKALALCKETGATLLVAKLDRLSRRVSQIAHLMESNIELKVALMPNANTFQLHIYASLAQQEREMIRDRVKRGMKAAKKKGSVFGAANPTYQANKAAGLHKTNIHRKAVLSEQKKVAVAKVREIIEINPTLPLDKISDLLNNYGIKTSRGGEWGKASVSRLCKDNSIERKKLNKHITKAGVCHGTIQRPVYTL